jgi:hypothetical protein
VLDKKKLKRRHTLTEEKFVNMVARLEASLKKSLCQLALQSGVSESAAHVATKLLKLKLHGTTVVYHLLPPDA